MNDRLQRLVVDIFGAGVQPGVATPQFYVKAQLVSVALAVAIVAAFAFSVFYAQFSQLLSRVHFANGVFYIGAYWYFRRTLNVETVTRICCISAMAVILTVNWTTGGLSSPALAWFILPAVASALVLGWRDGWFWIAVGSISATVFLWVGVSGGQPVSTVPPEYRSLTAYLYCLQLAFVIGVLFSFWVARQNVLEGQLNESLARSEKEAYWAGLLAESAIAANGSMDFEQAARVCLTLVCGAQDWAAGHIWRVDSKNHLRSTGIWEAGAAFDAARRVVAAAEHESDFDEVSAAIAANTASTIVGLELGRDPRFSGASMPAPQSVLAWPVEIEGKVDLVLEFFSAVPIELDEDGKNLLSHVAMQLSHVRVRELVSERTEQMAFMDPVTGLPNRAGFEHLFAQKLKDAKRAGTRIALMFVDLDGFKRVNDSLGHATGDRLLQTVGRRLEQHVRPSDVAAKFGSDIEALAARLGGDEFTLVLTDLDDADGAAIVAQRFLDVLSEPIDVGLQEVNIGASIGIAMYPDDGANLSELMRLADAAMYEAKTLPGNQFRFATARLNDAIQRRLWIENELHLAIANNDLRVAFAPIAAANSGRIVANEVMLFWPHRDGDIAFREFVTVAESSGLLSDLGHWQIDKTCAAIAAQRWGGGANVTMCLDISLLLLQQPHFVDMVGEILRRYDCPKGSLEFEFSDTAAILKNEECRRNIRALHEMGIRVVLDRFGIGYSSLLDLSELPVWRIKLKREFMETVNFADGSRSMGRAIISMAHSMGIETTIFNITTAAQARRFRDLGCDALQGPWVGAVREAPHDGADRPRPGVQAAENADLHDLV